VTPFQCMITGRVVVVTGLVAPTARALDAESAVTP
jgi:hypothetical protein